MKTKEYKVRLSDDLAKHLGATPEEIESRLCEIIVLSRLEKGQIDVNTAAAKLGCDPNLLHELQNQNRLAFGLKNN